jgi:hypothetical protein
VNIDVYAVVEEHAKVGAGRPFQPQTDVFRRFAIVSRYGPAGPIRVPWKQDQGGITP